MGDSCHWSGLVCTTYLGALFSSADLFILLIQEILESGRKKKIWFAYP